jgi:hypothetical protein
MAEKFADRIKVYCDASGVEMPVGFYRHPASRYFAIDMELLRPKLVAKTWFNQEDLVYYLKNLAQGKKMRILDFKERRELYFEGGETLKHGREF